MKRLFVPWSYPVRSLAVRWKSALFSAIGIAMTVAVLCGVFALRDGFQSFMTTTGRGDLLVYMRKGATSEGESGIPLTKVEDYKKSRPEVAYEDGKPLAAGETYLALFLPKADGLGEVNVPIRGVEEASFAIHGDDIRLVGDDSRMFQFGSDEIIVGAPISSRIKDTNIGDTLVVNVTPFKVVGVFDHPGAYRSEIWGDVDRIAAALDRPIRQRVIARVKPGTDVDAVIAELDGHKTLPAKVLTERDYFASQTGILGGVLTFLGVFLTLILGLAGILGAANTMLAAVGARTREIGVLRSVGFGAPAVLLSFLFEAALIGLVGGLLGCLLVLPLDGIQTGTMNWNTFTENTFAFQVTPQLLITGLLVAVTLGVVGGLIPAWRASRLKPIEALRRM